MQSIIDQIDSALQHKLYYVALFSSLVLPDICSALESDDGRTNGSLYTAWFDRHLGHAYSPSFTGADCYGFRCSILHQASANPHRSNYSRILFVEPGATSNVFHLNVMDDALNIDVEVFCRDLISAVGSWLPGASSTPNYKANAAGLIRRYENGLSPYISGAPVIG